MTRYEGKNVVITGGGSGIGLATAELFARGGARVLITGRNQATVDSARERLGDGVLAVAGDVTHLSDVDELAAVARAELGSVDALFVNAGVAGFSPFEQMTEQSYDELFAVNAKGAYFTVQKMLPLMKDGGAVVLTTSVANVVGVPSISAYAASKAALRSMARSLARELLPRRIRVNAVSPGPINTGILARTLPADAAEQTKAQMTADNPMSRLGDSLEVAKAVAFLAFDATYTTGAEFPVDGGASQL